MATWYERVSELLGEPGRSAVRDLALEDFALHDGLSPEDVDLLLRAATDLLPPEAALELSARLEDGADVAAPGSWAALVSGGERWELAPDEVAVTYGDDDGAELAGQAALGLPLDGLDLDFGRGAPDDLPGPAGAAEGTEAATLDRLSSGDTPEQVGPEDAPSSALQFDLGDLGVGPGPADELPDERAAEDEDPDDGSWHDNDHQNDWP